MAAHRPPGQVNLPIRASLVHPEGAAFKSRGPASSMSGRDLD